MHSVSVICLLMCASASGAEIVDASTLEGKVPLGYQGWFNCPDDGSPQNNWRTWARGVPSADTPTIDLYPDLSELDASERCPSALSNSYPLALR